MTRPLGGVLVVCMFVVRASAQPAGDPKLVAKQYVDAGIAAQKAGDFDTAIDLYKKADAVLPHPISMFNIAQAHRLAAAKFKTTDPARAARHRDEARVHYRKYLESKPEGDLEVAAQGWLAKLEQQWADEHPKEEAARRAEEERKREEATRAEEERLRKERAAQARRDAVEQERIGAAVTVTKRESQRSQARVLKVVGLSALGLGAAATGVGVYFGLRARTIADDLSADDVYDRGRIEDGENAERNMTVAYITGGTLIIGGAITYLVGRRIGAPTSSVALVPGAGGGQLVIGGSF